MNILIRNIKILILSLLILPLNSACDTDTEYDVLSGQLIGYITLYDNEGKKVSDKSGVEVVVEGSNPQIKVSTNEKGKFTIDTLKSGTYNFIFNKDGYCQHKVIGYQFVGGNKPASLCQTVLYGQSDFQIDSLKITVIEDRDCPIEYLVTAKISHRNAYRILCRYYLSDVPEISYSNYISTSIEGTFSGPDDIHFYLINDYSEFPVGSELYLIMYPVTEPYQYYIDINSGNKIYSSININKPSDVVSITIPGV